MENFKKNERLEIKQDGSITRQMKFDGRYEPCDIGNINKNQRVGFEVNKQLPTIYAFRYATLYGKN